MPCSPSLLEVMVSLSVSPEPTLPAICNTPPVPFRESTVKERGTSVSPNRTSPALDRSNRLILELSVIFQ